MGKLSIPLNQTGEHAGREVTIESTSSTPVKLCIMSYASEMQRFSLL